MLRWIGRLLRGSNVTQTPVGEQAPPIPAVRCPRLGRTPRRDAGLVDATARTAWRALSPPIVNRSAGWTIAVEDEPPADDPDVLGHCVADAQLIVLYRMPHLELAPTRRALEREVTDTVLHEVAYMLGLDDEAAVEALGPLRLPRGRQ